MKPHAEKDRLSQISTMWTAVLEAHGPESEAARAAQEALMQRYAGAVYRYLLRILGDRHAADDVFQQFAFEFVRGAFRHASPDRGRFRHYLKTSLVRLASRYRKRQRREATVSLPAEEAFESPEIEPDELLDRQFLESCRDELLSRAWQLLQRASEQAGQPWFQVLQYRSAHPDATSSELAAALTAAVRPEKPYSTAAARKLLERARRRFADLLLDEVSATLVEPNDEQLEEEVIALGLHCYCVAALRRRRARRGKE